MSLAKSVLEGDPLALARLLTRVENDSPEGRQALIELFPYTGKAHLVGVTGAPGTGKSSLVNRVASQYRNPGQGKSKRVAIIAVDPSSPFTGGAILGDRVRMRDLSGDSGVFIRSMASRGSLGGLARTTVAVAQVFDAAGFDMVLIETVGAGQAEVDIAKLAHTTLVVEAPGFGDDIQAIKAGILEIADILVVNKSDIPGAENTERSLRGMLDLANPVAKNFRHHGHVMNTPAGKTGEFPQWIPPVLCTVALDGTGVKELVATIDQHAEHLHQSGAWKLRELARLDSELESMVVDTLKSRFRARVSEKRYSKMLEQVVLRSMSPWEAANKLLDEHE